MRACWVIVAVFLVLQSAIAPVAAAQDEPPTRILVTFANDQSLKTGSRPVPGKNYRYRAGYRVPAELRRHIKALSAEYGMTAIDDWPIQSLRVFCVVYAPQRTGSIATLLAKLNDDSRIESAQPMHRFESMTSAIPHYNDEYAGLQYALDSMDVSAAQRTAVGKGVAVTIIDSGIDRDHEDFLSDRIHAHSFVDRDVATSSVAHGTAVASLIVANPNNGKGIVGVAPAADLTLLRACWASGDTETAHCNSFTLAKALDYIAHSAADVVNLSIAGPRDALLGRLIHKVQANGTIVVAAKPSHRLANSVYPADFDGVLGVAATSQADVNQDDGAGWRDTLAAPGEQIMVALPHNNYDFRSGSSLAAAHASGVIALLLERSPGLSAARVADILRESQSGGPGGDRGINACRALAQIDTNQVCP